MKLPVTILLLWLSLGHSSASPIQTSPFAAYLFAYFVGEGRPGGESISFAVSNGPEPNSWRELNGGRPVLTSNLGTKGVRDPTILRSHDGSRFYILATDLKIEGQKGNDVWARVSQKGSRNLVIWESPDLKTWSKARMVTVSSPEAGNTWAPEAEWDARRQEYMVYWASSMFAPSDKDHKGRSHHRIMRSYTKDFNTFSKPEPWIDPGDWSVIDTCMVRDGSKYHRFTKDERVKFIWQDSADSLDGPWRTIKKDIGKGSQARAEGPTVYPSITTPNKWHMFLDEFGGRGYLPLETTNIAAADWRPSVGFKMPKVAHHGSVIPM